MNRYTLHCRRSFRVPLAACGIGAVLGLLPGAALAQRPEPAARMLPARPVDDPPAVMSRAATPEYSNPGGYTYRVPTSIPAPNYGTRPVQQPVAPPPEAEKRGMMSGLKDLFGGKSSGAITTEKPRVPTPVEAPRPVAPNNQMAPAVLADPAPTPGVYAGPPAYRWFGYGSPTPGANQFAPGGLYPKGSANWYSQTGATPGAFPVPVAVAPRQPSVEPPSYVGHAPIDGSYLPGTRIAVAESRPTAVPESRSVARSGSPVNGAEPQVPFGSGTPIATPPTADQIGATDMAWQPISGRYQQPIATTPAAGPPQPRGNPASDEQPWLPSRRTAPNTNPGAAPNVMMIRGQAPEAEEPDLPALIRSVCFGRASGVEIKAQGTNKLHVKLTTPTESDARDAAALVSRLPELKAYIVTFEATISR